MSENLAAKEPPLKHGYAQVGDVRLHYVRAGAGDRLVLLLHGFPECWYSWRHQLAALGRDYTVIAPDLRGYNMSDKPPRVEDYRIHRLVDDVTGLVRHFGAREAAVVGHDWGAVVAWAVAQHYPDYVWKLAAMQVPPPAVWAKNLTLRQLMRSWYMFFFQIPAVPEWLMQRGDYRGLAQMLRKTSRPGTFKDADIDFYKASWRVTGALTGGVNYYRANVGALVRRKAGGRSGAGYSPQERIRVPTLFVYGERDAFLVPETVQGVVDYVDAPYREVRLAASNHWVQQEYPREVNAALLNFLKD